MVFYMLINMLIQSLLLQACNNYDVHASFLGVGEQDRLACLLGTPARVGTSEDGLIHTIQWSK